jgi:hypothetical protein
MKILISVFLIFLAVLKSDQAAGCKPPPHSVWNSNTKQRTGAVVAVRLPDAWFPWHREAVHSTLQQADSGKSRSKEFSQGTRSRSVFLLVNVAYSFKVNVFWEVRLCVLVERSQPLPFQG